MKINPSLEIYHTIRAQYKRIIQDFKRGYNVKPHALWGCDLKTFIAHIESKWKDGMTWANHGFNGWHIDHIIPCSKFDFTKRQDREQCFHYTNTQPLWHFENSAKGGLRRKPGPVPIDILQTLGHKIAMAPLAEEA